MNDFERKLSRLPFIQPPAALREAIFADAGGKVITPEPMRWTWRDWLWPAPQAWAALAVLWMIFAALSASDRSTPAAIPFSQASPPPPDGNLISYRTTTELKDVLDLAN